VVSRAKNILEAVVSLQVLEGIPWGKGPNQVISHLKTELGDDTEKKISLLNRSRGKLKDPKKVKTLEKVLSMLQSDETPGAEKGKGKEPDHVADFNAKVHAILGDDDKAAKPKKKGKEDHEAIKAKIDAALRSDDSEKEEAPKSKGKDAHAEFKSEVDAALGDKESKEKPEKGKDKKAKDLKSEIEDVLGDKKSEQETEAPEEEKGKKAKDLKSEIETALGGEESEKESGEKKSAPDLKADIDAALGSEEPVEKGVDEPQSEKTAPDIHAEIDAALSPDSLLSKPEKLEPPEPPVIGGESLGGGPGMAEASSTYAKKESSNPEAAKVLKKVSGFSQGYPNTSKVISSGLGGINSAVAHYQSAKSYKENPTSSTGMVSKHPVMTSALIGGPTGVAASASYFARKEEGKPRAEVWEKVADFAGKHPKTSSVIGGGGVNPALAYYYASKQKKPKKQKTEETPPEPLETSNLGG
jgi:hypothetical protein